MSTDAGAHGANRPDFARIVPLVVVHLAGLVGAVLVPVTPAAIALFVVFTLLTGFGVTVGMHRLFSHRSFECSAWHRCFWAVVGTAALQGGPLFWVGHHRRHHQHSDRDGDPHSPRHSLLEGHFLWMTRQSTSGAVATASLTARELTELLEWRIKWLNSTLGSFIPWLVTLVISFAIGGLSGLVWGGFLRTLYVWHTTWIVNSVGHRWGPRTHDTRDGSRNLWWLTPFTLGDQWHNNHHANPRAAILTEIWWQFDPAGLLIILLERVGLATRVVRKGTLFATPAESSQ